MPRVKGEVELHGVPVPVGLRRHVYWKASPVLAALSKHCTNCIPPYLYRGVFDELDKLATRLEGTEPHSHSALTANDLCNQVTTAHYRRTDELLRRKENRLVPDPFPSHSTPAPSSGPGMTTELRTELSRVQSVLTRHLVGIHDSATQIQSTQTTLKRRIDAIESKDAGGSGMLDQGLRKAESRIGLLEQRGQIVASGMSDALKRVGELEGRLDFQEAMIGGCQDAVRKVKELQERQTRQEQSIGQCLVDIKSVGTRLDGLEAMMRDIKAMLESPSAQGTPAPKASGQKAPLVPLGQLPTPPKEKSAEELAGAHAHADVAQPATSAVPTVTETRAAKRQRLGAGAE